MKTLLINPETPDFIQIKDKNFPLSLLYLGSSLKANNHDVRVLDVDRKPDYNLEGLLSEFNPDLVGITCLFSGKFENALNLSKNIKSHMDVPIIFGGLHPTIFHKDILTKESTIDYVCLGEGERTIVDLANNVDPKDIQGLAYRDRNEVKITEKKNFMKDLDNLPFPDFNLINIKDYYLDTSKWINPKNIPINVPVPIISSRSCPNRCNFCSMFIVHGEKWRPRSASNVVDEIERIYNEHDHKYFSFFDDNIALSKKRAMNIANEIIKRDLNIQFDTPNGIHMNTLDKELLDTFVDAGLVRITVAPEHGSSYIRNEVIGKRVSDKQIYNFFDMIKEYNDLFVHSLFIMGFPQETKETLESTFRMIDRISDSVDRISLYDLVPFPGTTLFDYCKSNNLLNIPPEDKLYNFTKFSNFNGKHNYFIKPYDLDFKDLDNFRERLTKSFPEIRITR